LPPCKAPSQVATDGASPSPSPALASSPAPTPSLNSDVAGSGSVPGAFTASTESETYDFGNGFDYKGKCDGAMYCPSPKSNASDVYPKSSPSCCHACSDHSPNDPNPGPNMGGSYSSQNMGGIQPHQQALTSSAVLRSTSQTAQLEPRSVQIVCLTKKVQALLNNPPAH
jgi:hypothetical protein